MVKNLKPGESGYINSTNSAAYNEWFGLQVFLLEIAGSLCCFHHGTLKIMTALKNNDILIPLFCTFLIK